VKGQANVPECAVGILFLSFILFTVVCLFTLSDNVIGTAEDGVYPHCPVLPCTNINRKYRHIKVHGHPIFGCTVLGEVFGVFYFRFVIEFFYPIWSIKNCFGFVC
jgi:hypothetical protein